MKILKKAAKYIIKKYNKCRNDYQLKRHHVKFDNTLTVNGKLLIFGDGIQIGKNVRINCGCRSNPIGGDSCTILRTEGNGTIEIGDNTGISNSAIVAYQYVYIGKNVLLGGSCKIYDTDFHSLDIEVRMKHPVENIVSKPVVIEDGVFIGAHSIILKGVTIGENSIVGAGSVVTKSIPAGEIWAGNPARQIKRGNT